MKQINLIVSIVLTGLLACLWGISNSSADGSGLFEQAPGGLDAKFHTRKAFKDYSSRHASGGGGAGGGLDPRRFTDFSTTNIWRMAAKANTSGATFTGRVYVIPTRLDSLDPAFTVGDVSPYGAPSAVMFSSINNETLFCDSTNNYAGYFQSGVRGKGLYVNSMTCGDFARFNNISAAAYFGDGSHLTGIAGGSGSGLNPARFTNYSARNCQPSANVNAYGAKGDGVTDDTAAVQAAIDVNAMVDSGKDIILPGGCVFIVGSPIILHGHQKLCGSGILKAGPGFSGGAVLVIKQGDGTNPAWYSKVDGITVDANFKSDSGIEVYYGRECNLTPRKVIQANKYGIHAGSANYPSTGINVHDTEVWFHESSSPVTGREVNDPASIGVYHHYCTDSYVSQCYAVGYRTGFQSDGGSNQYAMDHAWNRRAHGPLVAAFKANSSGCSFVQCYADTPHNWYWNTGAGAYAQDGTITEVCGFDIESWSQYVTDSKIFINPDPLYGATDNLAVGVKMGSLLSSGGFGYVMGFSFGGGDSSHRYKRHFSGSTANCVMLGINDGGTSQFVDNSTRTAALGFWPVTIGTLSTGDGKVNGISLAALQSGVSSEAATRAAADNYASHGYNWQNTWSYAPLFENSTTQTVCSRFYCGRAGSFVRFGYQSGPTRATAVHAARAGKDNGSGGITGSLTQVTFNGYSSVTIPPSSMVWSDPVAVPVSAADVLNVKSYMTGFTEGRQALYPAFTQSGNATMQATALPSQRGYIGTGNDRGYQMFSPCAAQVLAQNSAKGVDYYVFGDSIAAGVQGSANAWPFYIANNANVYNGATASARCDTEITNNIARRLKFGLKPHAVFLLLGTNDIQAGRGSDAIETDLTNIANTIRATGVSVVFGTIIPRGWDVSNPKEPVRQEVNAWIRSCPGGNACVDLDAVVRDPGNTNFIAAAYDSGDSVHPNSSGAAALANAFASYQPTAQKYPNMNALTIENVVSPATPVNLYCNWSTASAGGFAAGNDSNSGLDISHPLRTLSALFARIASQVRATYNLYLAPVIFREQGDLSGKVVSGSNLINIIGSIKQLLGNTTATSATACTGATAPATVHRTGAGWTPDAYKGGVFYCYSSPVAGDVGLTRMVMSNTTSTINIPFGPTHNTAFNPACKFRIIAPATTISGADAGAPTTAVRPYGLNIGVGQTGVRISNIRANYCASAGINFSPMSGGSSGTTGVPSDSGAVVNCELDHNLWGISANQANLGVYSCSIHDQTGGNGTGIFTTASVVAARDNLFLSNTMGAQLGQLAAFTLQRNWFDSNTTGIFAYNGASLVFSSQKNAVVNSSGTGVKAIGVAPYLVVTNVYTSGNTVDFIIPDGTYTPTLTGASNVAASTAYPCQYSRIGNTVTVSGKIDVTAMSGGQATELGISLPHASNLANDYDCCGTGVNMYGAASETCCIRGDATNDRASIYWPSCSNVNHSISFTFTYTVK